MTKKDEVAMSRNYTLFHDNKNKPIYMTVTSLLFLNNQSFTLWISANIKRITSFTHKLIITAWFFRVR